MNKAIYILLILVLVSACHERDYIRIVGSFTIYPAMIALAEQFAIKNGGKTPVVEAGGSGNGIKLFCEGVGYRFPDIVNSSRPIKKNEIDLCNQKDIKFKEIKLGYDAIVFARTQRGTIKNLNIKDLYQALARYIISDDEIILNNNIYWSDIRKDLPKIKIKIYGPTSVSGTRDVLIDEILVHTCMKDQAVIKKHVDEKERKGFCSLIRNDGAYVETSENDNLTALKLASDRGDSIGVVKFGFFINNKDSVKAIKIDNIYPSVENIRSYKYPLHRVLYSYVKLNNMDKIPALKSFSEVIEQESKNKNSIFEEFGLLSGE